MDVIQIILLIASVVSSTGTILAVLLARKSFLADHERRKKQSTIEFYDTVSNGSTLPLRQLIYSTYGRIETITPSDDKYMSMPELREKTRSYLRNMERLSTGINLGVYDFEVFYSLSGEPTIQLYKALMPLIEERRKSNDAVSFCIEFEKLYHELVKRKQLGLAYYKRKTKTLGAIHFS